jgi:hypothetical protein
MARIKNKGGKVKGKLRKMPKQSNRNKPIHTAKAATAKEIRKAIGIKKTYKWSKEIRKILGID